MNICNIRPRYKDNIHCMHTQFTLYYFVVSIFISQNYFNPLLFIEVLVSSQESEWSFIYLSIGFWNYSESLVFLFFFFILLESLHTKTYLLENIPYNKLMRVYVSPSYIFFFTRNKYQIIFVYMKILVIFRLTLLYI